MNVIIESLIFDFDDKIIIFVAIFICILEIHNHHSLVEGLGGIADKALF